MSQVVVDSCVAIKWLIDEPDSEVADCLLDESLNAGTELLAPDSIGPEVGNVLWTRFHRGLANAAEVRQSLDDFHRLPITLLACGPLLDDALRLALDHDRSFYDCLFLALSLREDCPLVTADKRLFNAVGKVFPNLRLLGAAS